MPIPLFGFLKGDSMGLVILGHENETVRELARKLQRACDVRVAKKENVSVFYKGHALDGALTVSQAGFEPLERFDVVAED